MEEQYWGKRREEFVHSQTPRRLDPKIEKSVHRGNRATLFVGITMVCVGTIISAALFPSKIAKQWRLDHDPTATVAGSITEVTSTNISLNKKKVMENSFRFRTEDQTERAGLAYTTGKLWHPGASVQVRYLIADPQIAAPIGSRLGATSASSLFILAFPIIGASILVGHLIGRSRRKHLLRDGLLTTATVTSIEPTSTKVDHAPQFKVTLTGSDLQQTFTARFHHPEAIALFNDRLQKAEPVQILQDRNRPNRFLIPELWKP